MSLQQFQVIKGATMSVLQCDRRGCDNIMCDRYSGTYGCICSDCFDELCALGPEASISSFMYTPKTEKHSEAEAYARFNAAFPCRD